MDPLLVLVGPTASGKSAAAIPVAVALDAEIVSLDSMLLYRGMDIGTAKPREHGGVPHHLIDVLEPEERFDLRRYLGRADEAIASIRARGRRALVVGGTGLYLMGLMKGVFEGVPRNPALRKQLAAEEPETLHRRLAEVDPAAADRIHPNDRRRLTRALEVHAATERPLDELQTQFDGPDRYAARIAGIRLPREVLRTRIRARVAAMFEAGLVAEVERIRDRLGPTAGQAVGYKEIVEALESRVDPEEARRLVERNTLQLMRRQSTWFKRFDVRWFDGDAPGLPDRLVQFYRGRSTE